MFFRRALFQRLVLLGILLPLSTYQCAGQILNIEKYRLDSLSTAKPYQISFDLKLDFYNRSATAEEKAVFNHISSDVNMVFAPRKHAYILLANIAHTSNNSNTILNNGYLHLRNHLWSKSKWSLEIFGQIQYDAFRGLSNRNLVGSAVRWTAISHNKFQFIVGTGPFYEFEKWRYVSQDLPDVSIHIAKWNNFVLLRWVITEGIDFNTIVYYQTGYDKQIEALRHRVSSTTNFNIKLSTNLSVTSKISTAYESDPVVPITKFIYSVENGVLLKF